MRRSWLGVMGVGLWLGAGCAFEPEGAERFQPPEEYREWFTKTESCSKRSGNFDRIEWYVVPGRDFPCSSGRCVGHWRDDHVIYIAAQHLQEEMVVRHEMLHDLLGIAGHPDPPFGASCHLTWTSWGTDGLRLKHIYTRPGALGAPSGF